MVGDRAYRNVFHLGRTPEYASFFYSSTCPFVSPSYLGINVRPL